MLDKEKLLLAIDKAQNPGACSYEAGCVVAQYADLVGWDRSRWNDSTMFSDIVGPHYEYRGLTKNELQLLHTLQLTWDNPDTSRAGQFSELSLKMLLKARVEGWFKYAT